MRTIKINKTEITSDLNQNQIIEIDFPVISYPYSFTQEVRKIEQRYITGANNIPKLNPTAQHSKYPLAKCIDQSQAEISATGFATFTRTFYEYPGRVLKFPTTISYTFPKILLGYSLKERDHAEANQFREPFALRKNTLTKLISVNEYWNFFYSYSAITEGGEIIGYESSPEDINIIKGFFVYDADYQSWEQLLPSISAVNFVDSHTNPNFGQYLTDMDNESIVPLRDSVIDHVGGWLYLRKTIYGKLL